MLTKIHHQPIKFIAICLALLVYGSTLVNHMVYYHSHITSNGKLISHAHPYNKSQDKSPIKSHHHSTIDLLLLFGDGFHHFNVLHQDFTTEAHLILIIDSWIEVIDFQSPLVFDKQRGPPQLIAA